MNPFSSSYSVYIMTNKQRSVLYTGVARSLKKRVFEHRSSRNSFTARYYVTNLVYYHSFSSIEESIKEEKRINGGSRKKKLHLITALNPTWQDLTETLDDDT
jgi:putative endonuclease